MVMRRIKEVGKRILLTFLVGLMVLLGVLVETKGEEQIVEGFYLLEAIQEEVKVVE